METRCRRFVHASAFMSGYSLSLNKLEADILQGGSGWLQKEPGYTHAEIRCARVSHSALCRGLAWSARALPFFAFAKTSSSRYALVRASRRRDNELLLSRKTTSFFLPACIAHTHTHIYIYIRVRYNESSAEHNYFTLLTHSMTLLVRIL